LTPSLLPHTLLFLFSSSFDPLLEAGATRQRGEQQEKKKARTKQIEEKSEKESACSAHRSHQHRLLPSSTRNG
jgi:Flp pilus assembly protein TadB